MSKPEARRTAFEQAFHRVAERHERIWIFLSVTLLALLLVGTAFYVVADFGVVPKTAATYRNPATPAASALFHDGKVVKTGASSYSVYMLGRIWHWTPNPVHVPAGAQVTFYVTSADVVHGFEVQDTTINLTAIPGVVGKITYHFEKPGTYNVLCNEYCGLGHQGMVGRIIVDRNRS